MVREPRRTTAATWEPRGENWLFATTGTAAQPGLPVFETRTTVNGRSALTLHPVPAGPMELRTVRSRADFLVLYRADGAAEWTLHERFFRPDLPATLPAGMSAYSGWELVPELWNDAAASNRTVRGELPTDLSAVFDYVRFDQPAFPRRCATPASPTIASPPRTSPPRWAGRVASRRRASHHDVAPRVDGVRPVRRRSCAGVRG